jgi:hypothetical protein
MGVLAGCGGSQRMPSGRIRFTITGRAPSGVVVSYAAEPGFCTHACGPTPVVVLSNHARLPYHATLEVDPSFAGYTLIANGLGTGRRKSHINCTIRIGHARATDRVRGTGVTSGCYPSLAWSPRLGHWVKTVGKTRRARSGDE